MRVLLILVLAASFAPARADSVDYAQCAPDGVAVGGFDVVSYHHDSGPLPGRRELAVLQCRPDQLQGVGPIAEAVPGDVDRTVGSRRHNRLVVESNIPGDGHDRRHGRLVQRHVIDPHSPRRSAER